jgi:hypothetical protein
MMYVDIPTRDELRSLLAERDPLSVSIFLPTTPLTQDTEACRIALGHVVREVAGRLEAEGADRRQRESVIEQIEDLIEDDAFWRFQARSLVLFATPGRLCTYRVPNTLSAMHVVSDRFHVKPLLRAVSFPQAAHVLALAAGGVRLLEVAPDLPVVELRVPDMPRDAASAVGKASIKDRSHAQRIVGSEGEKVRLRQYARQVDRAARELLQGRETPLVLAASERLQAIFRSVNSQPQLLALGILDSPDTLTDAELGTRARAVLDATYAAQLATWREHFALRDGQGRGATDVAVVARAAAQGAVASALVDIDANLPGRIDPESGAVSFSEAKTGGDYGVVDEIARLVIEAGGEVLAVRAADIPGGGPVAAVLRYRLA